MEKGVITKCDNPDELMKLKKIITIQLLIKKLILRRKKIKRMKQKKKNKYYLIMKMEGKKSINLILKIMLKIISKKVLV